MDGNTSTLRNRFNTSSKDDKENKSDNEFEFSAPSLIVADDLGAEDDQCDKPDSELEHESVNLIDLNTDLNASTVKTKSKHSPFTTNGDQAKQRGSLSTSNAKLQFGGANNFRFNFQMPREIKTKDKVDEASENFLDTVHTPTKRLQAESTDNKHKKARLDEDSWKPNLTLMTKISLSIGMCIVLVQLFLYLYEKFISETRNWSELSFAAKVDHWFFF